IDRMKNLPYVGRIGPDAVNRYGRADRIVQSILNTLSASNARIVESSTEWGLRSLRHGEGLARDCQGTGSRATRIDGHSEDDGSIPRAIRASRDREPSSVACCRPGAARLRGN